MKLFVVYAVIFNINQAKVLLINDDHGRQEIKEEASLSLKNSPLQTNLPQWSGSIHDRVSREIPLLSAENLPPEYRTFKYGNPDGLDLLRQRLDKLPTRLSLVLSPPIEPANDYSNKGLKLIFGGRFPPRVEAFVQRIQNYFSTYTQIDGQRPDYDPNRPTEISPIQSTTVLSNTTSNITNTHALFASNETDIDSTTVEDSTIFYDDVTTEVVSTTEEDGDYKTHATTLLSMEEDTTTQQSTSEAFSETYTDIPTTEYISTTFEVENFD